MEKFKEQMKQDFESKVPDVLRDIKQSPRFKVPNKEPRRSFIDIFRTPKLRYTLISSLLIVILAVLAFRGTTDNQVYASTVTMEINPSIEITFDENDRVINITALNDDGEEILDKDLTYRKMKLEDLVIHLVKRLKEQNYLENDENIVLLHVDGTTTEIQERVLARMELIMQREIERYNRHAKFVETHQFDVNMHHRQLIMELSQEYNISITKTVLVLRINQLDNSYIVEDLVEYPTRDLYELLQELSPDQPPMGGMNP